MMKSKIHDVLDLLRRGLWWPPIALLIATAYWFHLDNGIPKPTEQNIEKFGVYGDSFGRATSLFTALGFGGLIITILLQQQQIRAQEKDASDNKRKDQKARYEEMLFKLMEVYRSTLSEVRVRDTTGRDVIRNALDRVDSSIVAENIHCIPRDIQGRWDSGKLTDQDKERIDYFHFRNFKIVSTEINAQARLVGSFQVLLEHMVNGAPDHLLVRTYRDLVFSQFTFLECRYFFLVALSQPNKNRLRELMDKTGFLEEISASQLHQIHRDMYKEYWGYTWIRRVLPPSIPIPPGKVKRGIRAQRAAGGVASTKYTPSGVKNSQIPTTKDKSKHSEISRASIEPLVNTSHVDNPPTNP